MSTSDTQLQLEVQRLKIEVDELQELRAQHIHTLESLNLHQEELRTQNEELREARRQLKESEQRYKALFEHAPVGYALISANGILKTVNYTFCQLLGSSYEKLVSHALYEYLSDQDGVLFHQFLRRTLKQNIYQDTLELQIMLPGGAPKDFVIHAHNLAKQGMGDDICHFGFSDISARKQAERARAATEARYSSIISTMSEGLITCDLMGKVNTHNLAAKQLLDFENSGYFKFDQFFAHLKLVEPKNHTLIPFENIPINSTLKTSLPQNDVLLGVPLRNQSVRWLSINTQLLRDENNGILGAIMSFRDVSALRQAEAELRRERDILNALFESVNVLVVMLDMRGNIVRLNHTGEALTGYQREEVIGQPVWDIFIPKRFQANVKQVFSGIVDCNSFAQQYENPWLMRDGSERIFNWANSLLVDSDGNPEYVVALGVDMTKRHELETQQRLWAHVFTHADWGIVLSKENSTNFDEVNPAFARERGYTVEELRGKSLSMILPETRQEDADKALKALKEQHHVSFESVHLRKDGSQFPVWIDLSLVEDNQGQTLYRVASVLNIEKLKEAEQRIQEQESLLRSTFKSMNDLVFIFDMDGHFFDIPQGYRVGMFAPPKVVLGKHYREILPPDVVSIVEPALLEVKQQQNMVQVEYPLQLEDKTHWFSTNISPRFDEHNNIIGMTAVARDITERKQFEDAFVKARQDAEAANLAKSAFLANMSHELRTPLNAIMGYAQLMKRSKVLPEKYINQAQIIERSGEHLLTLITDILDLAKIEAGRIELFPEPVNTKLFFEGLVELFVPRAEEKGLLFHIDVPASFPAVIYADPKRLRQVLMNLLSNALKFTDQGQVRFSYAYNQGRLDVIVQDSGPGISADNLKLIFEPFSQLNDSLHKHEGTGLGLAITKQLVDLMDGVLDVESELEQGSLFRIQMPLKAVFSEQQEEIEQNSPTSVAIAYKRLDGKVEAYHILVVDDIESNRTLLSELLTPLGFVMTHADNGKECLEIIQRQNVDAIFMDIVMPEMDGLEATRQIRQLPGVQTIPIIAVSASAFGKDRELALVAGGNEHIAKPININTVLEALATYLKLEWQYATETPPSPASSQDNTMSKAQAEQLLELIQSGDIKAINRFLSELEQSHCCPQLAAKLISHMKRFQLNELRLLLKRQLL